MIVTCENCDKRFNLDESLIKESGSKVKCSECHHIFTVHKLVPVEEPDSALEEAPADLPVMEETPLPSLQDEEAPEEAAAVSGEAPEEVLDFDLSEGEEEAAEEEISLEEFGLEEELTSEEPSLIEKEDAVEEAPVAAEISTVVEDPRKVAIAAAIARAKAKQQAAAPVNDEAAADTPTSSDDPRKAAIAAAIARAKARKQADGDHS